MVSMTSLSQPKTDSLLLNRSFVYARTARDTVFYKPLASAGDASQKHSIFKIKNVIYYKGDFIYPRGFIKKLKNPEIDEFEDRIYWHFFYKDHYLSLKYDKLDNSFLLRIARVN